MNIENVIKAGISLAFKQLFNSSLDAHDIALQPTRKEFEGQYTFVTFPYGKISGKNPEETGKIIGQFILENLTEISAFNVVKGFLNLVVADSVWQHQFQTMASASDFGQLPDNHQTVMVEYSSPNTNKPLHLGHLRNNFLGFSVSQILAAAGYNVVKTNIINDRGIHICKSMLAYQKFGNGETPQSANMKGDHLIGKYYVEFDKHYKAEVDTLKTQGMAEDQAKKQAPLMLQAQAMLQDWERGHEATVALWKQMNEWVYEGFEATYKRMGVNFDKYYYESNTYLLGKDIVEEGLQKGVFFRKPDGSVWIDLTADGLDEKLVLRADGTSVYITQDLGTADLRFTDFAAQKSVYVVGNEQDYHFNVLFLILKKLGRSYADGLYHLSYGMVDLPSGKMKSREGTVVDADELMEEMVSTAKERTLALGKVADYSEQEAAELYEMLGIGAIKYFLLKVEPKKRMLFNPEESIELQGNTATAIQYTHARISSILRKAKEQQVEANYSDLPTLQTAERELIILLADFPKKIREAADSYSPATIAAYAYDVAREYNRFVAEVPVLSAETEQQKAFRVALSELTAKVLRKTMGLLGVSVPSRM